MFRSHVSRVLTLLALVGASLTLPALGLAPAAHAAGPPLPSTVTADSLPTVQINGVVWKQVIVGNTVYAGGEFTSARPAGAAPGTSTVPRSNLLAYDIRTGVMITSFAPTFNGRVNDLAVTPDGSKLIAVGTFTTVERPDPQPGRGLQPAQRHPEHHGRPRPQRRGQLGRRDQLHPLLRRLLLRGQQRPPAAHRCGLAPRTGALLPLHRPGRRRPGAVASWSRPTAGSVVLPRQLHLGRRLDNPGYGLCRASTPSPARCCRCPVNSVFRDAGPNSGVLRLASDGTSFYGVGWALRRRRQRRGHLRRPTGPTAPSSASRTATATPTTWRRSATSSTPPATSTTAATAAASRRPTPGRSGTPPPGRKSVQGTNTARHLRLPRPPGHAAPRPAELASPTPRAGTYTGKGQATWTVTGNTQYVLYGGEFPRSTAPASRAWSASRSAPSRPTSRAPARSPAASLRARPCELRAGQGPGDLARAVGPRRHQPDLPGLPRRHLAPRSTRPTQSARQWNGKPMTFTDTGLTPGTTSSTPSARPTRRQPAQLRPGSRRPSPARNQLGTYARRARRRGQEVLAARRDQRQRRRRLGRHRQHHGRHRRHPRHAPARCSTAPTRPPPSTAPPTAW